MISAVGILILSTALGIFYLETLCENILRREIGQPFFKMVASTIQLEFPHVSYSLRDNTLVDFSHARSALKSDFELLTFLARNADPKRGHFSVREHILLAYFKILLQCLPVCHAAHVREKQTVARLKTVLYYLTNLVGERMTATNGKAILAIN